MYFKLRDSFLRIHFRFVTGLGVGGTIAVCGQYAYEMTTRDMRGLLCCSIQLPVALGILFSYVIGKYVAWNTLALVNMCLLIPYWILIKTTPESPYFLVGRGKEYSASKSIEWLHGRDVNITDHELFQIKQVIHDMILNDYIKTWELIL